VILESECHKAIPAQEVIRSQIAKEDMSLFAATKKRSNDLEKTVPCLNYNQAQIIGTREGFSATGLLVTKLRNRLNDESVL